MLQRSQNLFSQNLTSRHLLKLTSGALLVILQFTCQCLHSSGLRTVLSCRSEAPAVSPPVEEAPPATTHRVQHQSAPRLVSSAVVSDGTMSWAQKIKAAAPVQAMYEPEQGNEYEDQAYHESPNDGMVRLCTLFAVRRSSSVPSRGV